MNAKALLQLGAELLFQFRHGNQAADRAFAGYVARRKFLGATDKRFLADVYYHTLRHLRRQDEAILSAFSGTVLAQNRITAGFPVTAPEMAVCWEWPAGGPAEVERKSPRQYPEDRAVDTARLGLSAIERGLMPAVEAADELIRTWPRNPAFRPVQRDSLVRIVERAAEVAAAYQRPKRVTEADRAHSWPPWLWAMLTEGRTPEQAEATARALAEQGPATLRVNTLKTNVEEACEALRAAGIEFSAHEFLREALVLDRRVSRAQLPRNNEGWFEWQDAGSQAISALSGVRPGMKVLDACAGGGGKTLHLAALMRNEGELYALDADETRLEVLHRRAARAGVTCLRPARAELPQRFDLILLDVPCSGTGALRRNPEVKWRLSVARMEVLRRTQRELLDKWGARLAPGGVLLYATCSLLGLENENQVEEFLEAHPSWRILPPEEESGFRSAVTERGELKTDPALHGCDGFYAARLAPAGV